MKKLNKTVTILLDAAISVGCVTVSAAGMAFRKGKFPFGKRKPGIEMTENKKFEITDEQKAEMLNKHKEMLKERLDKGEITQEEYDEQLKAAEEGKFFGFGGRMGKREMPEKPEMTDEQKAEMLEKHKEMLKDRLDKGDITQEEYDEQLKMAEEGTYKAPPFMHGKPGGKRPGKMPEKNE